MSTSESRGTRSRTRYDALRSKTKRQFGAGLPLCRRCGAVSALDPCRKCATPAELAAYPTLPGTPA